MVDYISYSDKPENAPSNLQSWAYALKIVKILSPASNQIFTEEAVIKAIELANIAGFNESQLQKAIDNMKKILYEKIEN